MNNLTTEEKKILEQAINDAMTQIRRLRETFEYDEKGGMSRKAYLNDLKNYEAKIQRLIKMF